MRNRIGIYFLCPLLWITLLSVNSVILSQNGPAGIGNSDGSDGQPQNILWISADNIQLSDGSPITTWNDQSGNNNHLVQTNSTLSPIWRSNVLNGFPIAEFSQPDNRIVKNPVNNFAASQITSLIVYQTSDNNDAIISYAVPSQSNEYLVFDNSDIRTYINGSDVRAGALNDGSWNFMVNSWRNTGDILVQNKGDIIYSNSGHKTGVDLGSAGSLAIGGEQDGVNSGYDAAQDFDGNIAEIAIFNNYLNSAQRNILSNYISTKYNINFATPANDYLTLNDPAWHFDVLGVGQESDGGQSYSASAGFTLSAFYGLDNGEYVFACHDNTVNNQASINIGAEITASGAVSAWNRTWYVEKTGSIDSVKIGFDFGEAFEDGFFPIDPTNYVLLYRSGTSGNFTIVATASHGTENTDQVYFKLDNANLQNGYYTLATTDQTISPIEGSQANTWYSYKSGDWSDWQSWTLDPSGSQLNNDLNLTPQTSPTSQFDKVVILSGKTITIQPGNNNLINSSLTVYGRLNLTTTTGHSFNEIYGSGRILMQGDNFPSGDATHFISAGLGEGTVEFQGNGYSISTPHEFYHVDINLTNATSRITLLTDYQINGNLTVETGEFRVNDNTSNISRTIYVDESILIGSNGKFLVGTGNAGHILYLKGDLNNEGTLEFTNRTSAIYNATATNGYITLYANDATRNQTVQCDGPSKFYNIKIDKGIDKTYMLNLRASDPSYFNLFGRADEHHPNDAQLTDNNNALGLIRGTVKIGTNINIPNLCQGNNYNISERARLWVDGGSVTKNIGTAIVVYGSVQVSSGTLNSLVNSGFTLRDNGIVYVEGGTINVNQIRTSVLGIGNEGGYVQTGGTVNVLGGGTNTDYYVFNLTYPGNVFRMTGGILNINRGNSNGAVFINSDPGNIQVSGGTVNMYITDNQDFVITSKAPFYNVNMINSAGNARMFTLEDGLDIGSTDEDLQAQPLKVLNDLSLASNTHFKTNGLNVEIGRNFTINDNAIYDYDDNTTIFNGTEDAVLYIGDITSISPATVGYTDPEGENAYSRWEHPFYGFTLNKPSDKTLTFASKNPQAVGGNVFITPAGGKNISDWRNNLVKVTGPMTLESGILDVDLYSIRLYSDITNKGIMTTDYNPLNAQVKFRKEAPGVTRIVQTVDGSRFGNIRFNSGESFVEFTSDVYIDRMEYKHGRIKMKDNNIKIDRLDIILNGPEVVSNYMSVEDMFITNGLASDGGLTLYIPANSNNTLFTFPVGVGTTGDPATSKYTEARIRIRSNTDDGYITVKPVDKVLPTLSGGPNQALQYYWRIDHSGFTAVPNVEIDLYYVDSDADGPENAYVPGRVINSYTREEDTGTGADVNASNDVINYSIGPLTKGDYTAGIPARFNGTVRVLYARQHGEWHDPDTWSTTRDGSNPINNATQLPGPDDICVLGNLTNNYSVAVSSTNSNYAPISIAKLVILRYGPGESSLVTVGQNGADCDFGIVTNQDPDAADPTSTSSHGSKIIVSGPNLPSGDFGEFMKAPNTIFTFNRQFPGTNANISRQSGGNLPTVTYPAFTIGNTISEYPVLQIENSGNGGEYIMLPDIDIVVNHDIRFFKGSAYLKLNGNGANGDITVKQNIEFNSGSSFNIEFPGSGNARTLIVEGDIDFNNQANSAYTVENVISVIENKLILQGDVINPSGSSTFTFWNDANKAATNLEFGGTGNSYLNQMTLVPELNKIIMNKDSESDTAFINSNIHLNSDPSVSVKPIEMKSGVLVMNHTSINETIVNGGNDFNIPAGSTLELRQGQLTVQGDDAGIYLDGKLHINGGTLDMDDATGNGNNYIEYSASGFATLQVSGGSLIVGSQIRRGLSADFSTLKYSQSGGTVVVGKNAAPENNRGVFEILGDGSSFYHSGGDLSITRQQSNPLIAALYLDPYYSGLSTGTTIQLGNTFTPSSQTIGIYSTIPLRNLTVNNSSGNNPSVRQWQIPLSVLEELNIQTNSQFDANARNLILYGNFVNNGTFTANGNTTYWSGNAAQSLSGVTTFYNTVLNGTGTVTLNDSIIISNELNIYSGTLNDNSNSVYVRGYTHNDGTHVYGGSGNGIILDGTLTQNLTGTGTFGKLTISNPGDIFLPLGNEFYITNALRLEEGVMRIGKNLLTIGPDAVIEEGNTFSNTNMIETNISFTDKGVKKIFKTNSTSFLYPIGANNKYTPVNFNITSNGNNTGSITIKAADEMHPSIIEDTEVPDIVDEDNVLQYYWILSANGMNNFNATADFGYDPNDALFDNTYYTVANYIPARVLESAAGAWNKFTGDNLDLINHTIPFTFTSTDDNGISGDYTAGINNAIPNQIQEYQTAQNGDWTNITTWNPTIAGGPRGAIVTINPGHQILVDANSILNYSIEINGLIDLNTTFGHRFGIVSGNGTIYTENGILPAGIYDEFFSSTGGTIEFSGLTDYDILSGITEVNNLIFSGSDDRRLPNNILTLNGDLLINGAGVNVINEFDQKLVLKENLTLQNGTFNAGSGLNAVVSMKGSANQIVTGDFTSANAFNRFEIDNSNGVSLQSDIEIDRTLILTQGIIDAGSNTLTLNRNASASPVLGTTDSYVTGNLAKVLLSGDDFSYPVGDGNEQGIIEFENVSNFSGYQPFTTRYNFSDPNLVSLNTNNFAAPVQVVSLTEYWSIQGPSGASSDLTIYLDGSSDVANSATLSDLRIVGWNGSQWVSLDNTPSISGTSSNGSISINNYAFNGSIQYITLASVQPITQATIQLTSANQTICEGDNATLTFVLSGNQPYDFVYTDGTTNYTQNGVTGSTVNITVSPAADITYTLVSVSDINGAGVVLGGSTAITVRERSFAATGINIVNNNTCQGTAKELSPIGGSLGYGAEWFWYDDAACTPPALGFGDTYSVDPLSNSNYWVRAQGTCNTTATATELVEVLDASVAPAAITASENDIIAGESVILSFTGGSLGSSSQWYWFDANPASNPSIGTGTSITVSPAVTTTYYLQAQGGCSPSAIRQITITVNPLPAKPTVPTGTYTTVCSGDADTQYSTTATLNANSYIWAISPAAAGTISGTGLTGTVNWDPTFSGTASITVQGSNISGTGPASDPLDITVNKTPETGTVYRLTNN